MDKSMIAALAGRARLSGLERVDVTLQLVCAREKRVAAAFTAGAGGALHEPPLLREPAETAGRENQAGPGAGAPGGRHLMSAGPALGE